MVCMAESHVESHYSLPDIADSASTSPENIAIEMQISGGASSSQMKLLSTSSRVARVAMFVDLQELDWTASISGLPYMLAVAN